MNRLGYAQRGTVSITRLGAPMRATSLRNTLSERSQTQRVHVARSQPGEVSRGADSTGTEKADWWCAGLGDDSVTAYGSFL